MRNETAKIYAYANDFDISCLTARPYAQQLAMIQKCIDHCACLAPSHLLPIVATTPAHLYMALSTLVDEHWHHIVATLARVPPTNASVALMLADMIVPKVIGHSSNSTRSVVVDRISSNDNFSSFDKAFCIELRASASSPASIAYIAELVSADASVRDG